MFLSGRPWWLSSEESTCNAGDTGDAASIPGSGRSPGGRNVNPLQYSCQDNSWTKEPGWLQSMGSNQPILKEINPEYSLEGLMLKVKLQYWPPDAKSQLIGKDPDAGKDRGQQRMRRLDSITSSVDISLSKLLEIVKDREGLHAAVHGVTKIWTQLSN